MMINMRFKDKDHQCVAADAGGVKKEDFIAVFKGSKLLGFRHIYCGDVVFL